MSRNDKNMDIQGGTNGPKTPPTRDVNAAKRVALALTLRARKMTYEAIATQCGFANASSCRKAIMRELDRCVVQNVDHLRMEEMDSLERLELECWKRLQDKEYVKSMLFAVDRIIAIKERRARLMGLDKKSDDNLLMPQLVIEEVPYGYLDGPAGEGPKI